MTIHVKYAFIGEDSIEAQKFKNTWKTTTITVRASYIPRVGEIVAFNLEDEYFSFRVAEVVHFPDPENDVLRDKKPPSYFIETCLVGLDSRPVDPHSFMRNLRLVIESRSEEE